MRPQRGPVRGDAQPVRWLRLHTIGTQRKLRFAMSDRRLSAAISIVVLLGLGTFGFPCALQSQQAKAPTLDEILHRLEANLNHYDKGLPSLFCDEQVVSRVEPGAGNRDTVTDSVFRVKRTANSRNTSSLVESREIKSVNGKAPKSQDIEGPSLLSGVFEGGLAVVSVNQKVCMRYELERIKSNRPDGPYVIRFATALTRENSADCLLQEKSRGRVFVDPLSMQITHLELTTPHHLIVPGNAYAYPVVGERKLRVDYAPVSLGGETFWLPSSITSRDIGDAKTFHPTVWSFQATYRNYHRLEVTSHILAGSEAVQ